MNEMTLHLVEYSDQLIEEIVSLIDVRLRADGFTTDDTAVPIVVDIGTRIAMRMIMTQPPAQRALLQRLTIQRFLTCS